MRPSGKIIGAANLEAVREYLATHLGASNRECAIALGLSEMSVGRHVKTLRKEWDQMKAFTLYQPWASLVVVLAKPFEFRGWNPRERGPAYAALIGQRIVIHAAARPMVAQEIREIVDNLKRGGANAAQTCLHVDAALELLMPLYHLKKPDGLPLSAGLGTAVLGEPRDGIDIAVKEFGFPEEAADEIGGLPGFDSDRREHANWGWPMLEVERWATPIPMRGFQGFWNWPSPEDASL